MANYLVDGSGNRLTDEVPPPMSVLAAFEVRDVLNFAGLLVVSEDFTTLSGRRLVAATSPHRLSKATVTYALGNKTCGAGLAVGAVADSSVPDGRRLILLLMRSLTATWMGAPAQ